MSVFKVCYVVVAVAIINLVGSEVAFMREVEGACGV